MKTITLTPAAALAGPAYSQLDQVWIADRNHLKRYLIQGEDRTATFELQPQTCFLALDVALGQSSLHYVPADGATHATPTPVWTVVCNPRHEVEARVWDALPEAEMVVVGRYAGTELYVVHGLETPVLLQQISWPEMDKHGNPYTALTLGTHASEAAAYLLPELAYMLHGQLPTLTAADADKGNGVFKNQLKLSGEHLFGTRRVWWGDKACSFTTLYEDGLYTLVVQIPSGNATQALPFTVLNQAGSTQSSFLYRRF